MTLVHRRVRSLENSPPPPLSKGEREAPGDLSEQMMDTNLVCSDLAVVVQQVFVQGLVIVCAVLLLTG